jgi:hypothetical protein
LKIHEKEPIKSMQKNIKNRLRAKTKKSKNAIILYPWFKFLNKNLYLF